MSTSTPAWILLSIPAIAAGASIFGAVLAAREQRKKLAAELRFQRKKFEEEMATQREKLMAEYATETSVEKAIIGMLSLSEYPYRSFPMIQHYLGGFEANELRRLLVRSGAVRFMAADGTELWALVSRVENDFKSGRWKRSESPKNKVAKSELFPGAFDDPTQH
jgi:hypothetical protein